MKIKICGLFRELDAELVNLAPPDYAGLVFAENSRRRVSLETAARISGLLDKSIKKVGVFVSASLGQIVKLYGRGIIDIAQLHGEESAEYIEELKGLAPELPVIRALRAERLRPGFGALDRADFLLLDNGAGGTGKTFDWRIARGIERPFFIAGGINSGNVAEAVKLGPYAVDISGGAETHGFKDGEKIRALVNFVRGIN